MNYLRDLHEMLTDWSPLSTLAYQMEQVNAVKLA